MQADQLRGLTFGATNPVPGRRVLAMPMHDFAATNFNVPVTNGLAGATQLGPDGSQATFVPARRAMSHQTVDPNGNHVVRERYWITFQPGEIRSCANCHGVNQKDQLGRPPTSNPPDALRQLLRQWKANNNAIVATTTIGSDTFSTITFKRQSAATALKQKIQYSVDLSTWTTASEYSSTGATQFGPLIELNRVTGAIETITLRETMPINGQPTRFYRVVSEK